MSQDKNVAHAKLTEIGNKISFSMKAISVDSEAVFFENFSKIFSETYKSLKGETKQFLIKNSFLMMWQASKAYKYFWLEIHKTEAVKKIVKETDISDVVISAITLDEAKFIGLFLLMGDTALVTGFTKYIQEIPKAVFSDTVTNELAIHSALVVSACGVFTYALIRAERYKIEENGLEVECATNDEKIIKSIREILKTSMIVEYAKE